MHMQMQVHTRNESKISDKQYENMMQMRQSQTMSINQQSGAQQQILNGYGARGAVMTQPHGFITNNNNSSSGHGNNSGGAGGAGGAGRGGGGGPVKLKPVLFYSKFCAYSNDIVQLLQRLDLIDKFVLVSVDSTSSAQQLPKFVDRVPLIVTENQKVIVNDAVESFVRMYDGVTTDPVAADYAVSSASGGYNFLSEQGAGGNKQENFMKNAVFGFLSIEGLQPDDNFPTTTSIYTPPDDSIRINGGEGNNNNNGMMNNGGGGMGGGGEGGFNAHNISHGLGMGDGLPPPMLTANDGHGYGSGDSSSETGGGGGGGVNLQNLERSREQMLGQWLPPKKQS